MQTQEQSSRWLPSVYVTIIIAIATLSTHPKQATTAKVLDIGDKLPEFIDKHPDRSWLVKFYAPWCHHCQQLGRSHPLLDQLTSNQILIKSISQKQTEPTYINVAERISRQHSQLIVGRVDCTKHRRVCENYNVESYPTIIYLDKDTQVKYKGDRNEESMINFAERLLSPSINHLHDCDQLKSATSKHGLIVLSTIKDFDDKLQKQFELLAKAHRSNYWFYHLNRTCKDFVKHESLYILKRHLNRAIQFPYHEKQDDNLRDAIIEWINKESLPVYGQIGQRNLERHLAKDQLLALAVLDEYKPAKRFMPSSHKFHKLFEHVARSYASEDNNQLLFGWTSDIELVEFIVIGSVAKPNLILLHSNLSYHLVVENTERSQKETKGDNSEDEVPEKLREFNVRKILEAAQKDKLEFQGGSSYLFVILRHIFGNLNKFMSMYRANPLLTSLLFGFPGLIVVFVVYTTCCYDNGPGGGDEEGHSDYEDDETERERLLSNGHLKQD